MRDSEGGSQACKLLLALQTWILADKAHNQMVMIKVSPLKGTVGCLTTEPGLKTLPELCLEEHSHPEM